MKYAISKSMRILNWQFGQWIVLKTWKTLPIVVYQNIINFQMYYR